MTVEIMDINVQDDAWASLGVPSIIRKALVEQNFLTPTKIQTLAIPPAILGRRDILGAAETGSGKTLAFGIPVLDGILKLKRMYGTKVKTSSGTFRAVDIDQAECDDDVYTDKDESVNEETVGNLDKKGVGLVKVINDIQLDGFDEISKPQNPLYALILTPTRELAVQIKSHMMKAAKYTDINVSKLIF